MKKTTRQYWTIVYSNFVPGEHDENDPVIPIECPDGLLVFWTKEEALEAVKYHSEFYGLLCHVVPLGQERKEGE